MRYSLGLDIGTSSVGWAVIDLEKERIHDLGVRIFERPEDPQNGDSLAKPRRDARSARRRLKRRRQRLNYLKQFFIDKKLLTKAEVDEILNPDSKYNQLDVYALRQQALNQELSSAELFKVIYQIAKRRGFKSNRKVEEESDKEGGRVSKALKANEKFLLENNYQTVGDALAKDDKFAKHKRNKRDDYTNSFARADFLNELETIIKVQRQYALKDVSDKDINQLIYGIDIDGQVTNINAIMYQRPFMTDELIQKMVGDCTFEVSEKRAPRASYSFEIFRLVNDLAHLVYLPKGSRKRDAKNSGAVITLTSEQINQVIAEAKNTRALSYGKVRKIVGISDEYAPQYVRGKIANDDPTGEKNKFGELSAYHDIKKALKDLPDDWAKVNNETTLNQIAYILTTNKADDAIRAKLNDLEISDQARQAILKIKPTNFKTFGHLSIKALQKITPYIMASQTYDKACELAGYDFRKSAASLEQITNPVVKRAIAQTIKVVRAIERKYGKPYFIKLETARDLAKSFKDRKDIERENKENQSKNQQIIDILKDEWCIVNPTGQQILKMKLRREQNGVCLYSGKEIDIETMLADDNAYQIDHIVPFSRSNDDGLANKVLVLTEENQKKANRTPFEYFGADEQNWKEFVARVESTYQTRDVKTKDKAANKENYRFNGYAHRKKQNLLIEQYKNDSWNVRALNDTRYITRFMMNYLRQTVNFADGGEKQRVFAPNGTTTAYLRKRWGLSKVREEDVLHHAADAAIVGSISPSVILRANLYAKRGEIAGYLAAAKTIDEKTDKLTGEITDDEAFTKAQRRKAALEVLSSDRFPEPWTDFRKEVNKRTLNTDMQTLQNELRGLEKYADDDFRLSVRPIFVSRMPRRKATGSAHKETIRSPKVKDGDQRTVRMPLNKLTLDTLEKSVLVESDRVLYSQLKNLLDKTATYDKKGKRTDHPEKAFADPVYKNGKQFDKNGKKLSPVSSIKVYSTQPSGFYLNGGKAFVNNGSMVRLDIYQKPNKNGKVEHFFVPVYAHQIGKNRPTPTKILPAPKGLTDIDKTFTKVCSLCPNDYVRCYFGNKVVEGYYVKYGINNGAMQVISHSSASKDKNTYIQISARSAVSIERLDISILGDNYRWS